MINIDFRSFYKTNPPDDVLKMMAADIQSSEGFWRLAVSPFSNILSWGEYFFGGLISPLYECKQLIGKVGVINGLRGFPNRLQNLFNKITELKQVIFDGISWEIGAKTADVYVETSGTVGLMADCVKLAKDAGLYTLTCLESRVIGVIGFMGGFSLFLTSINGISEFADDFWNQDIGSVEFNFALMKLVGKVLLVAISIIGMGTFLHGAVVSRIILLSISTMTLVLSIATHYYKKLHIDQGLKNSF